MPKTILFMKTILLTAIVLISGFTSTDVVYVCNSVSATKYHLSKDCRGLSKCKAEIIKVKLKDAIKDGRGLCGWEK